MPLELSDHLREMRAAAAAESDRGSRIESAAKLNVQLQRLEGYGHPHLRLDKR